MHYLLYVACFLMISSWLSKTKINSVKRQCNAVEWNELIWQQDLGFSSTLPKCVKFLKKLELFCTSQKRICLIKIKHYINLKESQVKTQFYSMNNYSETFLLTILQYLLPPFLKGDLRARISLAFAFLTVFHKKVCFNFLFS